MRWRLSIFGRATPTRELHLRRDHPSDADQRAFAKALLLGCLIGIGVSWQTVLSEGQRQHIYRGIGDLATAAGRVVVPDWSVHADIAQTSDASVQQLAPSRRPAVAPQSAPAPTPIAMPAPAEAMAAPLPERLAVAEREPAAETPVLEPALPTLELELTFDVNSSFLGPTAIGELRRKLGTLPKGSRYLVELQATVSDEGVKEASATEARRYNRWLAERRLQRVRGLLQQNARVELSLDERYVPHDPSRRILINARPAP